MLCRDHAEMVIMATLDNSQTLQGHNDRTLTIRFVPGWWVIPMVPLGLVVWYFIIKSILNLIL
jgi:hypothetical protein